MNRNRITIALLVRPLNILRLYVYIRIHTSAWACKLNLYRVGIYMARRVSPLYLVSLSLRSLRLFDFARTKDPRRLRVSTLTPEDLIIHIISNRRNLILT